MRRDLKKDSIRDSRWNPGYRIISWNMHQRLGAWKAIAADKSIDIVLVQEAVKPNIDIGWSVPSLKDKWMMAGYKKEFCAAVVGLSERTRGLPIKTRRLGDSGEGMDISYPGSLAVAEVILDIGEKIILISVYSIWQKFYRRTGICGDASAHRLISDISALVANKKDHRIIVAGDWNILFGYGEKGDSYWKARYDSVFERMKALGLLYVGPKYPQGIQAEPWPDELPRESKNVPTFRNKISNPSSATRQLDFVFASSSLHDRMSVKALNSPEEWGPSDHCRIVIDLK